MRAAATVARARSPDWFGDPLGGAAVRLPAAAAATAGRIAAEMSFLGENS